ncbi:copper-binding protein [Pseudothauera rhizosphaerae]|uniref:Copper-binding protein n=1 Tax=Pseudothauera rhizosphaerae TaxID=2565932 RepID=A0A4S4AW88_9RHOO|nr:copper-binding protein [Pseudothauera rhizosphaerae]THF64302.1 copper-binding protein [Pseudothauera rhizosphaerae]
MKASAALLAVALGFAILPPLHAAEGHGSHSHDHGPAAATAGARSAGTVRKVDAAAGKLTIQHGPLENLGMPPMTMVFVAADPALLDGVKSGDKVRFVAEKVGGTFTVTVLEVQP